jgi:hypothetical protein
MGCTVIDFLLYGYDSPEKRSLSPPRRKERKDFLNKSASVFACTGYFANEIQFDLKFLGVLCVFAVNF